MSPRLASVLSSADLPLAELCAARLDGELYGMADGWCPVDEADDARTRSLAAALLVSPRAIAERMTAAWIHGAGPEPARQQFCVDVGSRVHMILSPRVQLREVRVPEADLVRFAGIRVTGVLRTLADLARDASLPHGAAVAALARLLERPGCSPGAVLARLPGAGQQRALAEARLAAARRSLPSGISRR